MAAAERAGALVSRALWRPATGAAYRHCGIGAQAADCPVALRDDRARAGRRRAEVSVGIDPVEACHACGVYGSWRVPFGSDRHGEGTAAHVSGSRLHCLRSRAPRTRSDRRRRWAIHPCDARTARDERNGGRHHAPTSSYGDRRLRGPLLGGRSARRQPRTNAGGMHRALTYNEGGPVPEVG